MATEELDSSKIDALVEIGSVGIESTKIVGGVEIGTPAESIEAAKIDSFSVLIPFVVQHEHTWTNEWIGPPKVPGT